MIRFREVLLLVTLSALIVLISHLVRVRGSLRQQQSDAARAYYELGRAMKALKRADPATFEKLRKEHDQWAELPNSLR